MKYILSVLIVSLLLTSCAPAHVVAALPGATDTETVVTYVPPQPIDTALPLTSIPTATLVPCDPRTEDYCVTDGHFVLQRPIAPSNNDSVDKSYRYASTENGTREPHHGVEFLNKYGTPILAAGDGIVIFAGPDTRPMFSPWTDFYGNMIVIQHADGLYTLYAHLSKIDVQQGDQVKAGDKIGEVGQSGAAIGSHLHFEVRRENVNDYFSTQNPELWLMPERGNNGMPYGVLMLSIENSAGKHQYAEMTITRYLSTSDKPQKTYYLDTYVNAMATGAENAAMSDLPAGLYRIAFKLDGILYERRVQLDSGKLTQVVMVVK